MKCVYVLFLFVLLSVFAIPAQAEELTADQVLKKADDVVNMPKVMSLTSTLTVSEAGKPDKVRQLNVWQSQGMRLVKFTKPASEAGIALLSTDTQTNYAYLPEYEKVRRIAAHVRNQTFMGTDFSQEDMAVSRYATEYVPKMVSQTAEAWVLELNRKPGGSAGYGKLVVSVTKDHFLFSKIEYYDDKGAKLKSEERTNLKLFNDKYWILQNIKMTSAKDNHVTKLENTNFKFDENLPADFFSQRTLKRSAD